MDVRAAISTKLKSTQATNRGAVKTVAGACVLLSLSTSVWAHAQTVNPNQVQNPAAIAYQQQFVKMNAAERACLINRVEARNKSQRIKRGLGRLFQAIGRTALRTDRVHLAQNSRDASTTLLTIDDLQGAARDLGIVADDMSACAGQ
jgi:hypothetical protein